MSLDDMADMIEAWSFILGWPRGRSILKGAKRIFQLFETIVLMTKHRSKSMKNDHYTETKQTT